MKTIFYKSKSIKTLHTYFLIVSLILYLFRPIGVVDLYYNYVCFGLAMLSTYFYFKFKSKKNYFDFDTILIFILLIIGFFYPTFLYDEKSPFIFFYELEFNIQYINTGTCLFLIGLQSYFIGSLQNFKKNNDFISNKTRIINTNFLLILLIILTFLFIFFGGLDYFRAMYNENYNGSISSLAMQSMVLLHCISIVVIATEFYNKMIDQNYKISKILVFTVFGLVFMMLKVGNRTFASQLALPIIILWAKFYKNLNFVKVLFIFIVSIFSMFIVQINRSGRDIFSSFELAKVLSDLTIVSRATYSSLEYVSLYGFTYGKSMLVGIIGIIPSLESIIIDNSSFTRNDFGSAEVLTTFTLGTDRNVGLGTNLIADIYLSFGLIGLIFLMFFLGNFISKKDFEAQNLNYFSLVSLTVLLSYTVFIARSSYTIPIKLLVWCYFISKINLLLTNKKFK
jgi:oligosaccharide repeat unit polymerase